MRYLTSLRGVSLVVSILLAATGPVVLASSASADGSPPPTPTVFDASGTDQDSFTIPNVGNAVYKSLDEATYYNGGSTYPSNGASQVQLKATSCDSGCVDTPYTLVFNQGVTGAEAANTYRFTLGACVPSWGETTMTAYIGNVADATGRFLPEVTVTSYNLDGSGATSRTMRIVDGETRSLAVKGVGVGVAPGTNTVNFYLGDENSTPIHTEKVWVPACGGTLPPIGDPGTPPSVRSKKPTASTHFVKRRAYVTMKTYGVLPKSGVTHFRVLSDPRRGATRHWYLSYRNGSAHTKAFYRQRHGTVVTTWYKSGSKWVRLASVRRP